ncbi:MAG: HAD family hydrolase [Pseudomonadota bacterium]
MNIQINFSVLRGIEKLPEVEERIVQGLIDRDITIGSDIDGTLAHDTPGEHVHVNEGSRVTRLWNGLNRASNGQAPLMTGRPHTYIEHKFIGREFLAASEHGLGISFTEGHDAHYWKDTVSDIDRFKAHFQEAELNTPLLQGVQIEDHKKATATLGFTHLINPRLDHQITEEMMERMRALTKQVCRTSEEILSTIGSKGLKVRQTVTPTNAVVEILPKGVCKAKSFKYLRDKNILATTATTVFCGDSKGDKSVMKMVAAEEGGIALGVGPKAPKCSDVVFAQPDDLLKFLEGSLRLAAPQHLRM